MSITSSYPSIEWLKNQLYTPLHFSITYLLIEKESNEYEACSFQLNELKIVSRAAKITPTKTGQFVTCWKRVPNGTIAPFDLEDTFDVLIVNVKKGELVGQFVFPTSVLIEKGIISSLKKEGKRAFRVYPPWDIATNKQALQSQQWQLNYFLSLTPPVHSDRVRQLYFQ